MPRPNCPRRIRIQEGYPVFVPVGAVNTAAEASDSDAVVELTLDELEAVRLADYEGLYQEAAARAMGISRQTFGRIIGEAHRKIAVMLLEKKLLKIRGGTVRPADREENIMKIALPMTRTGMVDSHFGHCEQFGVFTADTERRVSGPDLVGSPAECGCKSNIVGILASQGVSVLLCGGIGEGAVRVLGGHGIKVVRGAEGSAEEAVKKYLSGGLTDTAENCHGHGAEGHDCGHH